MCYCRCWSEKELGRIKQMEDYTVRILTGETVENIADAEGTTPEEVVVVIEGIKNVIKNVPAYNQVIARIPNYSQLLERANAED